MSLETSISLPLTNIDMNVDNQKIKEKLTRGKILSIRKMGSLWIEETKNNRKLGKE